VPQSPHISQNQWRRFLLTKDNFFSGIFGTTIAHASFNLYMFNDASGKSNTILTGTLNGPLPLSCTFLGTVVSRTGISNKAQVPLLRPIPPGQPSAACFRAGLPRDMDARRPLSPPPQPVR
jgi:hypothetical protein